jgi:anti-sigma B factor antagonist
VTDVGDIAAQGSGAVIVTLPAEIDVTTAGQAYDRLDAAFASGAAVVVADLTATIFCDCGGISSLVRAHNRAVAGGAVLRLAVSPDGSVARVLQITGVDHVLAVYASTQAAILGQDVPSASASE